MSILQKYELSASVAERAIDPFQATRNKFLKALQQQIEVVKAAIDGKQLLVSRVKVVKKEDGTTERVKGESPVRGWFKEAADGRLLVSLKISNKPVELQKGKPNIVVSKLQEVVGVFEDAVKAVNAGEMDKFITASVAARAAKKASK